MNEVKTHLPCVELILRICSSRNCTRFKTLVTPSPTSPMIWLLTAILLASVGIYLVRFLQQRCVELTMCGIECFGFQVEDIALYLWRFFRFLDDSRATFTWDPRWKSNWFEFQTGLRFRTCTTSITYACLHYEAGKKLKPGWDSFIGLQDRYEISNRDEMSFYNGMSSCQIK